MVQIRDSLLPRLISGELQIPEDSEESKPDSTHYEQLCQKIKLVLGDRVEQVKISNKIESQPAIIVNPMGMSANMERILKAQALSGKNPMMTNMLNKKSMEINPSHPIMKKLSESLDDSTQVDALSQLVEIVYESALLSSGYQVEDINGYLKKVYSFMG